MVGVYDIGEYRFQEKLKGNCLGAHLGTRLKCYLIYTVYMTSLTFPLMNLADSYSAFSMIPRYWREIKNLLDAVFAWKRFQNNRKGQGKYTTSDTRWAGWLAKGGENEVSISWKRWHWAAPWEAHSADSTSYAIAQTEGFPAIQMCESKSRW